MPNANFVDPAWSHQAQGYVAGIREAAPTHVIVSDTTIVGTRVNGVCQTPLFIGPGVNWSQFVRVEISGCSDSVMVYLDAESTRNKFVDISIDARGASREAIAVDASSHNTFKRMTIVHELGGMFFYRNSGEAGVTRVTTPSFNLGEHMVFRGGANGLNGKDAYPSLWFSSRNGDRCYSPDDDGYAVGSSKSGGLGSNMDHSRGNVFVNALDIGPGGWVRDDGYGNAY
jgi:hypothetical protein